MIRDLQTILNQIGINVGVVDGVKGTKTYNGIREFQSIFGLSVDGIDGKRTWKELNILRDVKHFKVKEFRCRHCGKVKLKSSLLFHLEKLRKELGNRQIKVTSGYRCPTHNRNVGGATRSQHLQGTAADIQVQNLLQSTVYSIADKMFIGGGVGKYRNFTHVDVRGYKTRW